MSRKQVIGIVTALVLTLCINPAPVAADAAPAAPSALTASVVNEARVDLQWKDNSNDEAVFLIDRATDAGFTANVVNFSVGANTVSYTDKTVTAGTTYYFRVRASNGAGISAPSNVASVRVLAAVTSEAQSRQASASATSSELKSSSSQPTLAPPEPGFDQGSGAAIPRDQAPTDLTAIGEQRSVKMGWQDNCEDEKGYNIERSLDGVDWIRIGEVPPGSTSFQDKGLYGHDNPWDRLIASIRGGLERTTIYYYRVQAFNDEGMSAYSNEVSVVTK